MLQRISSVSTLDDVVLNNTPLTDVFEYFPDALIVANGDSRITYLNPAAEQLLGLPLEKVQGHALDRVLKLQDVMTQKPVQIFDYFTRQATFSGAFHHLSHSGGGQIPVQYSVALTRTDAGATDGYMVSLRNASNLQQYIDKLQTQTMHDEHTRLLRRAELIKRLWRLLQETDNGEPQAFMHLDLDNFNSINDTASYAAGDQAIRQIASRLSDVVRGQDTLARLGGDEFGLLLEGCPPEFARQRATQLHQAVESYVLRWNDSTFRLGVSIGVAVFKTRNHSLNTILAAAAAACCQAKRNGGDGPHIQEIQLD